LEVLAEQFLLETHARSAAHAWADGANRLEVTHRPRAVELDRTGGSGRGAVGGEGGAAALLWLGLFVGPPRGAGEAVHFLGAGLLPGFLPGGPATAPGGQRNHAPGHGHH